MSRELLDSRYNSATHRQMRAGAMASPFAFKSAAAALSERPQTEITAAQIESDALGR